MTSQRAKTREKLSEIGHSEQSEAKTFSSWITYTGKTTYRLWKKMKHNRSPLLFVFNNLLNKYK